MQVTSVSHPYNRVSFGAIALQKCMQKELSTVGKGFNKGVSEILQNFELPNKPVTKVSKGPYEIKEAKKIIAAYTSLNTIEAAAFAQAPGGDEIALMGNEALMAASICGGIYGMKISKTLIESMLSAARGSLAGLTAFKISSKFFTWVPLVGNALNATVAGVTTAALGNCIIDYCEKWQKENRK